MCDFERKSIFNKCDRGTNTPYTYANVKLDYIKAIVFYLKQDYRKKQVIV